MNETRFVGLVKAVVYGLTTIVAVVILWRGVIGPLWGSGSDFGLAGAAFCGIAGFVFVAAMVNTMCRDVSKHFNGD